MLTLFASARVYRDGRLRQEDVLIQDDRIAAVEPFIPRHSADVHVIDCSDYSLLPGFVDVHVHLRSPGFLYKETIATGTAAAARGGFTTVCAMPNLDPVPDSLEHLREELELIRREARVNVRPIGAITKGEEGGALSDMADIAQHVVGFSDDGRGVQSDALMLKAMTLARSLGKPIMAHCEDATLRGNGRVHLGHASEVFSLPGIPSECEWSQVKRDIGLVRQTGCAYHVQHVSSKETIGLIRQAKREGLPVTCETAPHYLLLSDDMITEDGRFLMNPPIRSQTDRESIIQALSDETIDCIATDHAPHSLHEKSGGLSGSLMGIVGLETAFPVLYTKLVLPGVITLERLLATMCDSPRKLIGEAGGIHAGLPADITVIDTNASYAISSADFQSMGRSTPFDGWPVCGKTVLTMVGGNIVYKDKL